MLVTAPLKRTDGPPQRWASGRRRGRQTMDNDGDHSTRASRAECLLTKVKVSLAVAIIKTKPPGVSGREFAEALACRLRRQDENWKEKSEELQQEVLRLRQEVLINRLTGNTSAVPVYALDHTYCSDPDEGSETPELLLPDPQSATLLPSHLATRFPHPSSLLLHLPPPPYVPPSGPHGETDLPQVHFLQALLSLQRLNDPLCFGADGGVLLVDSVCRLLVSVVRLCRDAPPLGPGESVLQACHVSARSMEMFCSHRLPDEEFRSRVEAALRDLTEMLLHKKGLHRLQTSEKLMECLITLGKSRMSKSFLLRRLLSQISALADRLWQSFKGQAEFPVDEHQNSCYLFWVVENLLQDSDVPLSLEEASEKTVFLRHLERAFQLSEEFPLFVICMWRIGSLLTSSDT